MKYIIDKQFLVDFALEVLSKGHEAYIPGAMSKVLKDRQPVEEVANGYWSKVTGMIYGIPSQYEGKSIKIFIQEVK